MPQDLGTPLGALRCGNPLERIVACTSSCGVNNAPGFEAESVVLRSSQTLLAANIAFGGLHRDMTEKKLDLLKLAPRIMAESRPRSSIMPHAALAPLCRMPDHAESKSHSPRCWLAGNHLRRVGSA